MHKELYLRNKNWVIIGGLFILLIIAIIISAAIGRYSISPKQLLGIVFSRIMPITQFWTERMETIFFNVRFPRILLAIMVGCCLSTAGAAFQGVFQNPMASPKTIGPTAAASFGAALAILNGAGRNGIIVSAFIFSLLSVVLVLFISKKAKGSKTLGLILSGIIVTALFTAGTSYIKLVSDPNNQLPAITYWLMGSLTGARLSDVQFVCIPMAIGLIPLFLLRWQMNVFTMGEDEARTMGINADKIRLIVIICASLITAASVSVSGMINWVGLVIPHLARKMVGSNHRYLIPTTMLFGAIFLLIVDNVSRLLWTNEVPIGILTAFIGAPFFLYLMTREENV